MQLRFFSTACGTLGALVFSCARSYERSALRWVIVCLIPLQLPLLRPRGIAKRFPGAPEIFQSSEDVPSRRCARWNSDNWIIETLIWMKRIVGVYFEYQHLATGSQRSYMYDPFNCWIYIAHIFKFRSSQRHKQLKHFFGFFTRIFQPVYFISYLSRREAFFYVWHSAL